MISLDVSRRRKAQSKLIQPPVAPSLHKPLEPMDPPSGSVTRPPTAVYAPQPVPATSEQWVASLTTQASTSLQPTTTPSLSLSTDNINISLILDHQNNRVVTISCPPLLSPQELRRLRTFLELQVCPEGFDAHNDATMS